MGWNPISGVAIGGKMWRVDMGKKNDILGYLFSSLNSEDFFDKDYRFAILRLE